MMAQHRDGPHNYTTLQRNVLDGLSSEAAKREFLWACDQPWNDRYCYRAEGYAHAIGRHVGRISDDLIMRHAERVAASIPGKADASAWNMTALDNPASLRSFELKRFRGLARRIAEKAGLM